MLGTGRLPASPPHQEFAQLKGLDYVNSDILTDYVKKGDTDATALLKKNAALLSIGINNIIMMYDLDVIVINSKLYEKNPQMIEQIHANLTSQFTKDIFFGTQHPFERQWPFYTVPWQSLMSTS